ncbi:hypothetical protein AGR1A_Cc40239 [Agrobacterium fabacearum CFBP 5771]|nr:hypothetical protein AGR1A_Cc40239 [Agrobacterium fabacearum CFBP 5771]
MLNTFDVTVDNNGTRAHYGTGKIGGCSPPAYT